MVPYATTVETILEHVEMAIRNSTDIKPGQQFIMITGFPIGAMRLPNFALLHTVGEAIYNPQIQGKSK